MKVSGKGDPADGNQGKIREVLERARQSQDAVKILTGRPEEDPRAAKKVKGIIDGALLSEDRVDVQLASSIAAELNPEVMIADRQKRLERIKAAVQAGTYNPPSEEVARRFNEEVLLEQLTTRISE